MLTKPYPEALTGMRTSTSAPHGDINLTFEPDIIRSKTPTLESVHRVTRRFRDSYRTAQLEGSCGAHTSGL